jgi:hypothetical protein
MLPLHIFQFISNTNRAALWSLVTDEVLLLYHTDTLSTSCNLTELSVVVVTPSSLSRLLVILYQDFMGRFGVQGWFAIAFPFYLLIFVHSLFLVFSSTSLHHLFLSFIISFFVVYI